METASWAIVAFTFALVVTTIVYTVMTRRLWQQTKRSYELSWLGRSGLAPILLALSGILGIVCFHLARKEK